MDFMKVVNRYFSGVVRRLHQQSTAVFNRELTAAGFDLPPMQFAALNELRTHEDLDQASLAEYIDCDRATLGGIVERLEKKGLVARRQSQVDRRARLVSITEEGESLVSKVEPVVCELQAKIAPNLSESERAELMRLLHKAINYSADSE